HPAGGHPRHSGPIPALPHRDRALRGPPGARAGAHRGDGRDPFRRGMMVHPRSILLACTLAVAAPVPAQVGTLQWAAYHAGFGLKEGIYADFMAFRVDRRTVPKERLRDANGLPVVDIRKVVSKVTWQPD